ncbi:MAG: YebC/PmpR family DNA-binding transcriptional regulator [Deltaproteobacteria bacterium]|nr:YebC/PmpR family DNA-binding transcriptional regulator [Deltaproteobacteria bacterium]
MSGHSKWSTIRHKKGAADAKRGKIFTKLAKEITLAAKLGGGDPDGNSRLRQAILVARSENMPKDNIEKAIKKGTGDLDGGSNYEEITYEGYGPGGVAVLVEVMTDNKNRTVSDIRHIFSKHGGNLGENGCVSWMFDKKGNIVFDKSSIDEDRLMEIALEAGAEDVIEQESEFEVRTNLANYEAVKKVFDAAQLVYLYAEISMIPQTTISLDEHKATQMLKLMDKMEDNDDVQHVYANFDIAEKIMEKLSA